MNRKFRDSKQQVVTGLSVEVKDDFNRALRTFSKKVQDSGMLRDLKERSFHEHNCTERKRKKKMARKRWEKKVEGMITAGLWQHNKPY